MDCFSSQNEPVPIKKPSSFPARAFYFSINIDRKGDSKDNCIQGCSLQHCCSGSHCGHSSPSCCFYACKKNVVSQARFLHAITLSVSQGVDATLKSPLSLLYWNMLGFWPQKNTNKLGRRGHSFVVKAGACVSSSVLPTQRGADPSPISSGLWATSRVEQFQEERLKGHCRTRWEHTYWDISLKNRGAIIWHFLSKKM